MIAHVDHALTSFVLVTTLVRIFSVIATTYVVPELPIAFVSVTSVVSPFVANNIYDLPLADAVATSTSFFVNTLVFIVLLRHFAFPLL